MVPWQEPCFQDLLSCCSQRRHPKSNFPHVLGQQNLREHHEHKCAHSVCFLKADCTESRTVWAVKVGSTKLKDLTLIIITRKNIFPTSSHGPTQCIKQKPDVVFTVCTEIPVKKKPSPESEPQGSEPQGEHSKLEVT